MAAEQIKKADFNEKVLQSDKPVLIDFWATWCGPCQMQGPIVEELSEELTDVLVGKVNVDEEPDLAERYNVMSIPTLLVFKNGEVVQKAVGLQSKENLLDMLGK
ncbi:MAG TPA: thioredoxin [Lachnospiraceae bacterium]|jgi:thioredoxin 1|nr:thioredoxin [Lachnospiraceae bacterium]MDD6147314.1 thioredoxin [Lachnospiraceae bacterium]MDY5704537.1 thioredoxin [Lachnospiraceae bacterium]MEE3356953.1 thioredoxin [Lachnospiraceae bacterium]HAN51278.1 thioredoxin [Lachnospiraceae bacterium]